MLPKLMTMAIFLGLILTQTKIRGYSPHILNIQSLTKEGGKTNAFPASPINCQAIRISDDFIPVCGADGLTYRNKGQMKCIFKVELRSEGACAFSGCEKVDSISPVCGVDSRSYPNPSVLACRKLNKRSEGLCSFLEKPDCSYFSCGQFEKKQVCGTDSVTYPSRCDLFCAGKGLKYEGPCRECDCPSEIRKVCGKDGVSYDNECKMKCANAELQSSGPCPQDTLST